MVSIFKKLKYVLIIVLISVAAIVISALYSKYSGNNNTALSVSNSSKYPINGYGIELLSKNNNIENHIININNNTDNFKYTLRVINNSGSDNSFRLMTYLNYEQIPFKVEDNDITNYKFDLKTNSEVDIPICFSIKNLPYNSNSLVFSVISGADKHADDIKEITDFYGTNARYSLVVNKSSLQKDNYPLSENESSNKIFQADKFNGIILNSDTKVLERFLIPDKIIHVKAGDNYNLCLRAGGFKDSEDFITWITLGWKQQEISSGSIKKFIYFHIPKGNVAYKVINLKAPMEKGQYEICGFLSTNPWLLMNDSKIQGQTIYTSYRITLDVE